MRTYQPDTPGYDTERTGFQLLTPHHPDTIVTPTTTDDIKIAVNQALRDRQPFTVQASGHGHATPITNGLLISTRHLTGVRIDPDTRTAHVDAGATWQHVIDAAAPHGLAPLSGSAPGVGAVSYTLGGGIGLLARPHGYAADHVTAIDIVTPDGQARHVTATTEPDLFWALRGGGGNFGIVTHIDLELLPVTTIHGGGLYYDLATAPDIVHTWLTWTNTVPDHMTSAISILTFPDLPMVAAELRGRHIAQIQTASPHPTDLTALRAHHPVRDTVRATPYTESATIFDEPNRPHAYRATNLLLDHLDPATIDELVILTHPNQPIMTVANIRHLGAALSREPETPNAVAHRDATYSLNILSPVPDQEEDKVTALHQTAVKPWAAHTIGASPNFTYGPLDPHTAYPPATLQRLQDTADHYDPHHLLRSNHPLH